MTDDEKLRHLLNLVDEHFEYGVPWRTWHLMHFVTQLMPDHLGWGSEEAANAYRWEADARENNPEAWRDA